MSQSELSISAHASNDYYLTDFASIPPKNRQSIVEKVSKIEKKTFPSNEVLDVEMELKKKKNTSMIVACKTGGELQVIGYLIVVRTRRLALLHKLCVVEQERKKGVGKSLMHFLRPMLGKGGCRSIHLWVDEARNPARTLYNSCGFQEIDRVLDYYGPGRTGLKMELLMDT